MIINNVTKEQSEILTKMVEELNKLPLELYNQAFKVFTEQCNEMGLIDKYNSDITYMNENLRKDPESNTYVRTNDSVVAYIANEDMIIEGAKGTLINNPEYEKVANNISNAYYKDGLSNEEIKKMIHEKYPNMPEKISGHKVKENDIILETKDGFRKVDREAFKEIYLTMDGEYFTEEELNEISEKEEIDFKF